MEQLFQNHTIEFVFEAVIYEVTEAFLDNDRLICSTVFFPGLMKSANKEGDVIISDEKRAYVAIKVKIIDVAPQEPTNKLTCEICAKSIHFFKRSFLRLKTDILVEYTYLNKDPKGEFVPVSGAHKGALIDLNTCGACLELPNYGNFFLNKFDNPLLFLKLSFQLPDEFALASPLEIISKVVNVKKTWEKMQIGILFIQKSPQDLRRIEDYYHKALSKLQGIDHS